MSIPFYSTYLDIVQRPRTGSASSSQTGGKALSEDSTVNTSIGNLNTHNLSKKTTIIIAVVAL